VWNTIIRYLSYPVNNGFGSAKNIIVRRKFDEQNDEAKEAARGALFGGTHL
jgi:hypothetical protein